VKGENDMNTHNRMYILAILGILSLFGGSLLAQDISSGQQRSPDMQVSLYKGELIPSQIQTSYLISNDVWLFHGEKGSRVVITDVVKDGIDPPDIYLYPPEGTEYEARSDGGNNRYQAIDRELKYTGDYLVLIHRSSPQDMGDYRLAFEKLPIEGSYMIDPDDPDGNLIKNTPSKVYKPRSGGIATGAILVDVATMSFGPLFYGIYSGVGSAVGGVVGFFEKPVGETNPKDLCPLPVMYSGKELALCSIK
jgi:hypothetical protein